MLHVTANFIKLPNEGSGGWILVNIITYVQPPSTVLTD